YSPAPLPLGDVTIEDSRRLPRVVVVAPEPRVTTLVIQQKHRSRLFSLSISLGDNLYRCGRYQEAERQYSLALSIAGPRREIVSRVEIVRRYLPPPPSAVIVPRPNVVVEQPRPVRPRLAVFGFYCGGDPGLVPAAMGDWAADCLAPYLGTNFELIERGEVCWYMGRLGVTMRELLTDPS